MGMRLLKLYVFAAATLLIVLGFVSLREAPATTRFEEINVERLNVVEKDGKVRLIMSNKARFPGLFLEDKEHPFPRGVAGIVFIDDKGTEYATLATQTRRDAQEFGAYSGLRFGALAQDPHIGMMYDDENGQREAGVFIRGPRFESQQQLLDEGKKVEEMPAGPEKVRAMAELRRSAGAERVRVARTKDQSAAVELSDVQGKPRLRLVVDAAGAARLEFLDAAGQVTRSLSGTAEPAQR
jgi:hypothetical protein